MSSVHSDSSRHISPTVSGLGENFSSRPATTFVQLKYSVTYGKMSDSSGKNDAENGYHFRELLVTVARKMYLPGHGDVGEAWGRGYSCATRSTGARMLLYNLSW